MNMTSLLLWSGVQPAVDLCATLESGVVSFPDPQLESGAEQDTKVSIM